MEGSLLTLAQETIPENNESYPGSDQGTFLGLDGTAVHQLTLKVMHLHMDLMAYLVSTGRKLVLKGQGLTDVNKEEEKRYLVSSNKREDMSKRAEQELALVIGKSTALAATTRLITGTRRAPTFRGGRSVALRH